MSVQTATRTDHEWMDVALELAAQGEALTSPNPMVGAVLAREGEEVARAFHTYDGVKHAEALALEAAGAAARGATLYPNLEPGSHAARRRSDSHGRHPPRGSRHARPEPAGERARPRAPAGGGRGSSRRGP